MKIPAIVGKVYTITLGRWSSGNDKIKFMLDFEWIKEGDVYVLRDTASNIVFEVLVNSVERPHRPRGICDEPPGFRRPTLGSTVDLQMELVEIRRVKELVGV